MPRDTKYVGLADAAVRLDVSEKTIRRMIARGDLRAYRLGTRTIRVSVADLEAQLKPVPTTGGRS